MSERQPIDDLFARVLRDAEADPSEAVWDRIVLERDRTNGISQGSRKPWRALLMVLLFGGLGAAWGVHAVKDTGGEAVSANTDAGSSLSAPMVIPDPVTAGERSPEPRTTEHGTIAEVVPIVGANGSTTDVSEVDPTAPVAQPHAGEALPIEALKASGTTRSQGSRSSSSRGFPIEARSDQGTTPAVHPGVSTPEAQVPMRSTSEASASDPGEGIATVMVPEEVRARFLAVRSTPLAPMAMASAPPAANTTPTFAKPRRGWWLGALASRSEEHRTWHGKEALLVRSLQSTELVHHTVGYGLMVGMELKGGWGFTAGAEYSNVRYDFKHLDRFTLRNDSLIPYLITFNAQVLESYSDTVTTYTEERRDVATVNRYGALRIPVEAGWSKGWHRWRFGARAGVALEFNTMRAGATLVNADGGMQSIDVGAAPVRRSTTLLTGSLAADISYGLSDRLFIRASPTWATGLCTLAPDPDGPYAMPRRAGIRFLLAYTLRPDR